MEEENITLTRRELLLSLLSNKSTLQIAQKLIAKVEGKKNKTVHTKGKQWRYCNVITTCKHCGVSHERTVTLETSQESFVYISHEGNTVIVTFKMIEEPCTFYTHTKYCDSCWEYIAYMSREELQERYISLLRGGTK